jgi:hypothetical protein
MATKFSDNSEENNAMFYCKNCDYLCFKLQHYKQHAMTKKHKCNIFNNVENSVNQTENEKLKCVCGKVYRDRSGLWRHKKICVVKEESEEIEETDEKIEITPNTQLTPELIIKLIEQNKELQQALIDQNKKIIELAEKSSSQNTTNNTTNNNNCGNTNKTFNLQVFLNETCKDAINMSDFVNQLQVSLSDLETTGRIGYAEGISKVFIKNLNDIDYTDRPLHCSDSKRETLYIKEDNKWTKDDDQMSGLTKAIKQVANKNIKQISEWQKLHPDFSDPESKQSDKYMKIVLNSMSGSTKEESDKNYEKIAKNVIKEVVIDK